MNLKRYLPLLALLVLAASSLMAATWEGSAIVGGVGDYPSDGLYASCNSFPRNSLVELKNLENGKSAIIKISGGVDNPGVFMALSPKTAAELGIKPGSAARIRASIVNQTAAPLAQSAPPPSAESADPDYNPRLLAGKAKPGDTPTPVQPTPSAPAAPQEAAQVLAPESPSLTATTAEIAPNLPEAALLPALSAVEAPPAAESSAVVSGPVESPAESVAAAEPIAPAPEPSTLEQDLAAIEAVNGGPAPTVVEAPPLELAEATPPEAEPAELPGETVATAPEPADAVALHGGETSPSPAQSAPAVATLPEAPPPEPAAETVPAAEPPAPVEAEKPPVPQEEAPGMGLAVLDAETPLQPLATEMPALQLAEAPPPPDPPKDVAVVYNGSPASPEPETPLADLAEAPEPVEIEPEAALVLGGEKPLLPSAAELGPLELGEAEEPILADASATETAAVESEEPEPAEIAITLEPTAPRPPEAGLAPSAETAPIATLPAEVPAQALPGPSVAEAAPLPAESPKPEPVAPMPPASSAPVPSLVGSLSRGAFYVQIAVLSSEEALLRAAARMPNYPLVAERVESPKGPLYRLYVGPLNRDEGGTLLVKFRSLGYKDAFIKQGS